MTEVQSGRSAYPIACLWDNFGPYHIDELSALADVVGADKVVGIELFGSSDVYSWGEWAGAFQKITLFPGSQRKSVGFWNMTKRIVRACRKSRARTLIFCHYERPYIFLSALILSLLGHRILLTWDSKFDDYTRYQWRELTKRLLLLPYYGVVTASDRARDYLRFQGFDLNRIRLGYDTLDPRRLRASAKDAHPVAYAERDFLCVARLVPKKNHRVLLEAYALYRAQAASPRRLLLCGSGPLENEIREQIQRLGLEAHVVLRGNLPPDEVARTMAGGLCLLLPSVEEQFGIVVREAQVFGLPVILSINCGARDLQVRSGVNGFVVESDNPEGIAYFMQVLSDDEMTWQHQSANAERYADRGDARHFAEGVLSLAR